MAIEAYAPHLPELIDRPQIVTRDNPSDADLMVVWTLKSGGNVLLSMPRIAVLRSFMMNHIVHHRAQLGVYLRLNNVPIPGSYGPSYDEKQGLGG